MSKGLSVQRFSSNPDGWTSCAGFRLDTALSIEWFWTTGWRRDLRKTDPGIFPVRFAVDKLWTIHYGISRSSLTDAGYPSYGFSSRSRAESTLKAPIAP
jgi:hypothetical protein